MIEAKGMSAQTKRGKQKMTFPAEREKFKDVAYEREKNRART
jgi:hypothetical protein